VRWLRPVLHPSPSISEATVCPTSRTVRTTWSRSPTTLLANLGIERPVLLGQSWGANVVMEYAARFPDQVAGVVPVDGGFIDLASTFSSWEECAEALAPPRLEGTPASRIRSMLRGSHPDWSELAIDSMMGFVAVDSDGLAAPHLSFDNHLRVLRGMWDHRPLERYRAITAPVWWIVAEPGAGAQNWAARKRPALEAVELFLPASRSTWMVGDHDLHAQHPQQVAQIVLDALSSGYFS
jgi:pimeloyl-ACP methyl ester carboxylesterase